VHLSEVQHEKEKSVLGAVEGFNLGFASDCNTSADKLYILSIRPYNEAHKSVGDSDSHFFGRGKIILKTKIFSDSTTVLNKRKHLKIVFRSEPDSVILFLD
jgi:hypothetical protein